MTVDLKIAEGDVYTYRPENNWCREGMAIGFRSADGEVYLRDTYWSSGGGLSDWVAADDSTLEFQFNLADVERVAHRSDWEGYAPSDRRLITSQHGLTRQHYIVKGASPDMTTIVENARQAVSDAEQDVRRALSALDYATRTHERLLIKAASS